MLSAKQKLSIPIKSLKIFEYREKLRELGHDKNKHVKSNNTRKRNRLKDYDYSKDGWYFVTVCINDRKDYFGEIKEDKMILNEFGKIVENQWLWIETQYNYVKLDEYVVMPNHIHGILVIENPICSDRSRSVTTDASQPVITGEMVQKIKSLSELVGAFKTTSSRMIHENKLKNFAWQRSFFDNIIRNEKSLNNIRGYICENPAKWKIDRNNGIDPIM